MRRRTVVALFALGQSVGIPLAGLYARLSPSQDRFFHAFVLYAACGVSFPAVSVFLTITLRMWDKAQEQGQLLADLRDDIKPLVSDAKAVVDAVGSVVKQIGDKNPKMVVDFVEKLHKDGTFEKIATSIETVAKKVHEAIGHGRSVPAATRDDLLGATGGGGDAGQDHRVR